LKHKIRKKIKTFNGELNLRSRPL